LQCPLAGSGWYLFAALLLQKHCHTAALLPQQHHHLQQQQ
jgi:hypothetical protein